MFFLNRSSHLIFKSLNLNAFLAGGNLHLAGVGVKIPIQPEIQSFSAIPLKPKIGRGKLSLLFGTVI